MRFGTYALLIAAAAAAEPVSVCVQAGRVEIPGVSCSVEGRTKIPAPGIDSRVAVASATTSPWIVSNAWRFRRGASEKFLIDAPLGTSVRAVAEALAFRGDLLVNAEAADAEALRALASLTASLPARELREVADFTFVDNGSPVSAEILNLLTRRNLMFRVARERPASRGLVVQVGQGVFTKQAAADPSAFAALVRSSLGDDKRSIRIYGTESAIVRLLSDGSMARVHIVNHTTRPLYGIRLRVRGSYRKFDVRALGVDAVTAEDVKLADGFTELSIPKMGTYAVVDLQ